MYKIVAAQIILTDGTTLEFPEMPLIDLAHALIVLCQPEYEIEIPKEKMAEFEQAARKDATLNSTVSGFDSHVELFKRKECEKYTLTERHKHAYNEAVLAYSEQLKQKQ